MKTIDWQIGDFIKYQGQVYIIEEISAKGWVHLIYPDTKVRVNLASDYIIDLLEPILLTTEILEKNGFTFNEAWEEWQYRSKDGFGSDFRLSATEDALFLTGYAKINFVYQLQHALRLCGLNELADNFKLEE